MEFSGPTDAEAYTTTSGFLVIKQEDAGGIAQTIFLTPEQAAVIAGFIQSHLTDMAKAWCSALNSGE